MAFVVHRLTTWWTDCLILDITVEMLRRGEDVEKARVSSSTRIGELSRAGDSSLDKRLTIFQWCHGLAHFHHYKNIKSPVRFTERDPK